MEISKENFLIAWKNQKLVRGALKYAHVRENYINYEDLLQEGILLYAQMLTQKSQLSRQEVDRQSFRKIIWHTIDLLRKDQRNSEHQTNLENAYDIGQVDNWNNYLAIKREVMKMSQLERLLFYQHLLARKTISSLACQTGLSRVHLQRVKRGLLVKLRGAIEQ